MESVVQTGKPVLIKSFSPLAGIRLVESRNELPNSEANQSFSPLAGIRLVERSLREYKCGSWRRFSPLAGIRLVES